MSLRRLTTFKIHVKNIPPDLTEDDLSIFEPFGIIELGVVPGRSVAFVHVQDEEAGIAAIGSLQGIEIKGKELNLSKSSNELGPKILALKIKLEDIPAECTAKEIQELFLVHGKVLEVEIKPNGKGHVILDALSDIRSALTLNGHVLHRQRIKVEYQSSSEPFYPQSPSKDKPSTSKYNKPNPLMKNPIQKNLFPGGSNFNSNGNNSFFRSRMFGGGGAQEDDDEPTLIPRRRFDLEKPPQSQGRPGPSQQNQRRHRGQGPADNWRNFQAPPMPYDQPPPIRRMARPPPPSHFDDYNGEYEAPYFHEEAEEDYHNQSFPPYPRNRRMLSPPLPPRHINAPYGPGPQSHLIPRSRPQMKRKSFPMEPPPNSFKRMSLQQQYREEAPTQIEPMFFRREDLMQNIKRKNLNPPRHRIFPRQNQLINEREDFEDYRGEEGDEGYEQEDYEGEVYDVEDEEGEESFEEQDSFQANQREQQSGYRIYPGAGGGFAQGQGYETVKTSYQTYQPPRRPPKKVLQKKFANKWNPQPKPLMPPRPERKKASKGEPYEPPSMLNTNPVPWLRTDAYKDTPNNMSQSQQQGQGSSAGGSRAGFGFGSYDSSQQIQPLFGGNYVDFSSSLN